jgi:4-methyl-5(b-hydroxyethyl)-thiazole monophosphate biosynthesis
MVSVTGNKLVKGAHDVTFTTDKLFEEVTYKDVDMIMLPGGMPGAKNLDNHAGLKGKILEMNQKGKWVTAICAAPMVLGHLGLLKGKNATCYPGFETDLTGANSTGNSVEIDGNIITGKGPGVAAKFALTLLEVLEGKQKADEVKKQMMME